MSEWEKASTMTREIIASINRLREAGEIEGINCPRCGHLLSSHDPADGTCDAHRDEGFGVCLCGRTCDARKLGDTAPHIDFPLRCTEPGMHNGTHTWEPYPARIEAIVRLRRSSGLVLDRDVLEALEAIERRLLGLEEKT